MKKGYPVSAAFIIGFAAFALSACIDNDYDLDQDIDFTIGVGGSEFALPAGMTEEIKLGKLLEVEEGDLVQVNEKGDYFLHQEGTPTANKVTVNGFYINSPTIAPIDRKLKFKLPQATSRALLPSYTAILTDEEPAKFTLEEENIAPEIQSISYISVNTNVHVTFSFSEGIARKLKINDIAINLPKYFVADDLENNAKHLQNIDLENGKPHTINIPIKGFDLTKLPEGEGLDGALHRLYMNGEISIEGNFTVNGEDLLTGEDITQQKVNLKADITLDQMDVKKVKGVVKPEIDFDIKPVTLNNLPDFLSDDEVRLDVKNPMIFFTLDNQIPAETSITGSLNSYKDNKRVAGPIPISIPEIKANENQRFCLSPEGSKETGVTDILVPELTSIIEKIPDEIRFDIDIAATNKEAEIELDKEYSIQTNYSIDVPFVFGPNLSIVYKDTIDGWQDDLEDFEIQTIHLTSKVINKIPLDLVFTAEAITLANDGTHTPLEGVTIKVKANGSENDNIIKAGGEKAVETPIIIEIKETTSGSIKKLDGLTFRAVAKSGPNSQSNKLNTNQTIQLKEVKLKVPGGLKVNLN